MRQTESSTGVDLVVFAALLTLLVATYEAARHDFGVWNFPIALGIAFTKATLIVIFFMKLRRSAALTQLAAGAGVFWLVILLGLTAVDYWTRGQTLGAP